MADQPTFRNFVRAFSAHWADYMTGGPSLPLMLSALVVPNRLYALGVGVLGILCGVLASFFVWRKERQTVIELDVYSRREAVRLRVAELITEGAGIRNEVTAAYSPYTFDEMTGWSGKAIAWHNVVLDTLKTASAADAEWYRTLNEVPSPAIPMAEPPYGQDEDHLQLYAMHNFRLKKLEQLVSGEKGNLLVRR